MPVLSQLLAVSRPAPPDVTLQIAVPISATDPAASQDVTVTYRPSLLVIALFDQTRSLIEHMPSFVIAWDFPDERGGTYPITHDSVQQLPLPAVSALLNGLVEHELWRNPDLPPGRKGRVVKPGPCSYV
jgi:hypothetical protein